MSIGSAIVVHCIDGFHHITYRKVFWNGDSVEGWVKEWIVIILIQDVNLYRCIVLVTIRVHDYYGKTILLAGLIVKFSFDQDESTKWLDDEMSDTFTFRDGVHQRNIEVWVGGLDVQVRQWLSNLYTLTDVNGIQLPAEGGCLIINVQHEQVSEICISLTGSLVHHSYKDEDAAGATWSV